jgi:hypothetical protein
MGEKLDLRKRYKELYSAKTEPSLVAVPELAAIAVDGAGDPNGSEVFQDCMAALYAAAYTLKFALKKSRGLDWTVMPPEGDWRSHDLSTFSMERKDEWTWTLLIVQPGEVLEAEAEAAFREARLKKPEVKALERIRFERRPAHEAAQILHIGPYDAEPPTIARLHAFIDERGLRKAGDHREIYMSDPRRGDPAKMKTIIRQPVAR